MNSDPRASARRRATGRVTLADVAQAAGVSPITVSRALRGERAVDPELVERVRAAAARLGYVPDPAARALASQRGTHVAVLIPLLSNTLFVDLIEALQHTLRPAGYQALIGITHYDPSEEEQLLREQLMQRYGEELPYRTSVEIERFEEVDGRYRIHALIWVERPSQKAIIIGKQGEALKAAASQARQEMQKLFDCPVHLEVWVKIKKSWSSDEAAIASLGYSEDH